MVYAYRDLKTSTKFYSIFTIYSGISKAGSSFALGSQVTPSYLQFVFTSWQSTPASLRHNHYFQGTTTHLHNFQHVLRTGILRGLSKTILIFPTFLLFSPNYGISQVRNITLNFLIVSIIFGIPNVPPSYLHHRHKFRWNVKGKANFVKPISTHKFWQFLQFVPELGIVRWNL